MQLHAIRHERGGEVIEIAAHGGHARVARQGAQLLSWQPAGQVQSGQGQTSHDVFWCSSLSALGGGKAIRGGVPVCWPWFGPHADDPKRPQHGFARNIDWQFDGVTLVDHSVRAAFSLRAADGAPHDPAPTLDARLAMMFDRDGSLRLQLHTTNTGVAPAPLSPALHSYFAVSDVAAIAVEGLDGATYRDNTRAGARTQQIGPMRIACETIALFDDAPSRQTIVDPGLQRRIVIERAGVGSTVVWNPGENAATMADIPPGEAARFLCVESGMIGDRAQLLAAGQTHSLDVTIRVLPLG